MVGELDCVWISNEGAGTMPSITEKLSNDATQDIGGSFVLAIDGRPLALTSPHGFYVHDL
jgi:hypothetical protein